MPQDALTSLVANLGSMGVVVWVLWVLLTRQSKQMEHVVRALDANLQMTRFVFLRLNPDADPETLTRQDGTLICPFDGRACGDPTRRQARRDDSDDT